MNKFLTVLILFGYLNPVKSQFTDKDLVEIKIPSIRYNKQLPVNHIEVIDCRYDTTKLGYVYKGNSFKKVVMLPSLAYVLNEALNNYPQVSLDPGQDESLLIVIKKLWLREIVNKSDLKPKSECISKFEIYLKKDSSYFPLKRIDSVYTYNDLLKNCFSTLLVACLERSLSLLKINFETATSAKKLKWEDIDHYNNKQFDRPILYTSAQRGIFLTFTDFLENRPDSTQFEIEFGKLTDQLYVRHKNDKLVFTEFWGFCDGEKLYVNGGFKFFELAKINNGFEFWANTRFIKYKAKARNIFPVFSDAGISLFSALANYGVDELTNPKTKGFDKPFQVNMETGEAY